MRKATVSRSFVFPNLIFARAFAWCRPFRDALALALRLRAFILVAAREVTFASVVRVLLLYWTSHNARASVRSTSVRGPDQFKLFKLLARLTLEGRWLAVARHPVSPSRMSGSIPDFALLFKLFADFSRF